MPQSNSGRPSRRQIVRGAALLPVAVGIGGVGLSACGTGPGPNSGGGGGGNGGTLFIAGHQWGTPTHFNPLGPSPGWPSASAHQYIYESLLRFNLLDGKLEPGLGKEWEQVDEATVRVELQDGVAWQDGEPLTVDDVVFTFELGKRNPQIQTATVWEYLEAVEPDGEKAVVFRLNPDQINYPQIRESLSGTMILPKHIWEPEEKKESPIEEFANTEPVGSGPYQLDSYNAQQVRVTRYDDYWGKKFYGGLPAPQTIVHPIFKDNQGSNVAFEQDEVNVSQNFVPQLWRMWEDKDLPVATWMKKRPYHIPGGIPMLVINNHKKGLDNPRVRVALAHAINYDRCARLAMSQYSDEVQSSLIVPGGSEDKFFDADNVRQHGWSYNPDRCKEILEDELKAEKGQDGVYVLPDGTRLGPFVLQTPSGWSDYQQAVRLVVEDAKKAGFGIDSKFPEAPTVTNNVEGGDFDLALWGLPFTSAGTPWLRFRDVLDHRGVPEIGERAFRNYGRFEHEDVPALIDQAAAAEDDETQKQAYAQLDRIYMENAPMIGLMYRPAEFFEFNETTWKGFPTEDDPYAPPAFQGAGNEWLWKIELA